MKSQSLAYGMQKRLALPLEQALERTREALKAEGFGVLFEIDMKEKLKEKLGVDFKDYRILGACNPPIAYQALQEEPALGLLLPCNLIAYEDDGATVVAAIDAEKMMSIVGNPALEGAARTVNEKLCRVIERL
ncbi:MAG TPA: DUF302 domain-containing protein [Acidobacteriota bacterium]|nr:DUF302 domain-containing protein [Acidobacteriota bacterium]